MRVNLVYMPVALVFAGCLAIASAIVFGEGVDGRLKLAGLPALVSAIVVVGLYFGGTVTLVLLKR